MKGRMLRALLLVTLFGTANISAGGLFRLAQLVAAGACGYFVREHKNEITRVTTPQIERLRKYIHDQTRK